jgi:hypothetical protein
MADSPETAVTILDHIDNIVVPGNVFAEPGNEYWALVWLWQGMEYLYHRVRQCDEFVRQQVNPDGNVRCHFSGNLPQFRQVPQGLLTCSVHWYAISACQYVGTVGAIAHRQDNARPGWRAYVEAIIPEVFAFRNKVAAHFAWCIGDKRDNPAERLASILPSLIFTDDCFQIAGYTVHVRRSGKASNSTAIQPWSLCRVHERLRQRYWPQLVASAKADNGQSEDASKPLTSILTADPPASPDQGDDSTARAPVLDQGDDPTAPSAGLDQGDDPTAPSAGPDQGDDPTDTSAGPEAALPTRCQDSSTT